MNIRVRKVGQRARLTALAIGVTAAWSLAAGAADMAIMLAGSQEVPPVTTSATGNGTIKVADDGMVSGKVATTGIKGTAAHIHSAVAGKNGPVIVPLEKDGDNGWAVPSGAKLTADQLSALKAGGLYVNVHSAAHPDGEIRGQLK
jgi:hypothetical protein